MLIIATIFISIQITLGEVVFYEHALTGGIEYDNVALPECNDWVNIRSSIRSDIAYNYISAGGSKFLTGYECTGPDADTIAQAMRTWTSSSAIVSVVCNGNRWSVGACGELELNVGEDSSVQCSCAPSNSNVMYIRPCTKNWGGYGDVCFLTSGERQNLVFEVNDVGSRTIPITAFPTSSPTQLPSISPSNSPTTSPTKYPTTSPTTSPTKIPTTSPTKNPTNSPTAGPTYSPTTSPTKNPTNSPTISPTKIPSNSPINSPTKNPTNSPTVSPTTAPSTSPTRSPTKEPSMSPVTQNPTVSPTTPAPVVTTSLPSHSPTSRPTPAVTESPTKSPLRIGNAPGSETKSPTSSTIGDKIAENPALVGGVSAALLLSLLGVFVLYRRRNRNAGYDIF